MKNNLFFLLGFPLFFLLVNCQNAVNTPTPTTPTTPTTPSPVVSEWDKLKNSTQVNVYAAGYGTPQRLANSTMGWEDAVQISKDGLDLYCLYWPGDQLSWTLYNPDPFNYAHYLRASTYDIDYTTGPGGVKYGFWLHGVIMYAHRNSTSENFPGWVQAAISRPIYSVAAPYPFNKNAATNTMEAFVFTSNDHSAEPTAAGRARTDIDIWCVFNTSLNPGKTPADIGAAHPTFPNTIYNEDNPIVERADYNWATSSYPLVVMFDSYDYNGVTTNSYDIWYSISTDNGVTWSTVANLTSVNTPSGKETHPQLFKSGNDWYLYYALNDSQILRRKKLGTDMSNWNDWASAELVIDKGNAYGIAEPSLTANGDLYFVLIYKKGTPGASNYDCFDSDPWVVPKAP